MVDDDGVASLGPVQGPFGTAPACNFTANGFTGEAKNFGSTGSVNSIRAIVREEKQKRKLAPSYSVPYSDQHSDRQAEPELLGAVPNGLLVQLFVALAHTALATVATLFI